jgi:hypothetical protein
MYVLYLHLLQDEYCKPECVVMTIYLVFSFLCLDPGKQTPLFIDPSSSIPSDGTSSGSNGLVFKRPGDPLESPAMKRTR